MRKNHDLVAGLVLGVLLGIHFGGLFIPYMTVMYVLAIIVGLPIARKLLS